MLVRPMRAESSTLFQATLSWAWWQAVRSPCFFASSRVAAMRSGRSPRSFSPSAPPRFCSATQARAASGVARGVLLAQAEEGVDLQPRGGDLAARALLLGFHHPGKAVARARVAHGRDAVAHPELEDVLRGGPLLGAARVPVHVDEAGHQEVPREVDLLVARLRLGPLVRLDGHAREAHGADVRDPVAFHHHVGGAVGRRARAVDDGHPAQDEPLPRPFALGARGGLRDLLRLFLGEGGSGAQGPQDDGHEGAEPIRRGE